MALVLFRFGKAIDTALYSNLRRAIILSSTIPVSSAIVKRSLTAMTRSLNWPRNSLDMQLASDMMVLSMNDDILKALDLNSVLYRWIEKKPSRFF